MKKIKSKEFFFINNDMNVLKNKENRTANKPNNQFF